MRIRELKGMRFGKLLVVKQLGIKTDNKNKRRKLWLCKCDCGGEKKAVTAKLIIGEIKSCGCWQAKVAKDNLEFAIRHLELYPHMAKGPLNQRSSIWRLRSPRGIIFEFKNLRDFIRENPALFDQTDVIWKPTKKRQLRCRAYSGIMSISPRLKRPNGEWKGWTWHSQTERLKNEGRDLLERQIK